MPSLKDLMTPYRMNNHNPLPIYSVGGNNLDLIEAELLAPHFAENARLTAQVAAADVLADAVRAHFYPAGESQDGVDAALVHKLMTYDTATAPANAEPKAGETELQQTMKTHDVLSAIRTADGDYVPFSVRHKLHERLDEHGRRLDLLNEAGGAYVTALHATNRRLDEVNDRLNFLHSDTDQRFLDADKRLDELAARVDFAVSMHHGQGAVIGELREEIKRYKGDAEREIDHLKDVIEENDERLTTLALRIQSLEAARQPQPTPSAPVVTSEANDLYRAAKTLVEGLMRNFKGNTLVLDGTLEPLEKAIAAFAARDEEAGHASN